jgi:hypothetical protein
MGWFSWRKKKEEPEPKKESDVETKEPEEPRQEFGVWRTDDGYTIQFSGGGEVKMSRRMYTFLDHFVMKFMSLGSYNNETLMKQMIQLLEQHALGFIEDYEEPDEPDEDEDDDSDDEPEDEPEDEPDPAAEEDEEVADEPESSVAEAPADVEAPAPLECVPSASLLGSEVS